MKTKILSIFFALLISLSVNAKEKVTVILAGSPGGTFNAFNIELMGVNFLLQTYFLSDLRFAGEWRYNTA